MAYLVLAIIVWYASGFYGGLLLFWTRQIDWQRSFGFRPALSMVDAVFIIILFPLTGLISLIFGAVLYTRATSAAYRRWY